VSVAEAAHRPAGSGRTVALWLGFLIIIAAGIGLAWIGAGSLRPIVTTSGLEFRTVKAGTGEPITRADAALLEYRLTSDDGTVFDQSQQPTPFVMDGVYPGFAEAMSHMQEGGQYRFSMPQRLTGGASMPPSFPKDSKLTFDVIVRKVGRGGAAMLQQLQAQQMQQLEQQQAPQQ
jgi:FKBP-type peptidyl-prolyl cis-trans isomerase